MALFAQNASLLSIVPWFRLQQRAPHCQPSLFKLRFVFTDREICSPALDCPRGEEVAQSPLADTLFGGVRLVSDPTWKLNSNKYLQKLNKISILYKKHKYTYKIQYVMQFSALKG